jgi:hypothetical protein
MAAWTIKTCSEPVGVSASSAGAGYVSAQPVHMVASNSTARLAGVITKFHRHTGYQP